MQYLYKLNDPDINACLESADQLALELNTLAKNGLIDSTRFYEATREICRAFVRGQDFVNNFEAPAAAVFNQLKNMMFDTLKLDSNMVLIPITLEVMQANGDNYKDFTDYLGETLAITIAEQKGLALEQEEEEEEEDYDGPSIDEINEELELSAEYADREDFENAVASLNRLLDMIEEFSNNTSSLLVIDVPGILNNKAYYLFRLNRLQEALLAANDALKLNSEYAIAYYTKAEILDEMGQIEEAIACMDDAIELEDSPDKQRFRKSLLTKKKH